MKRKRTAHLAGRRRVPLGQYDDTKLVKIGSNSWSLKPEIGCSKAFGPWTIEVAPAVAFYTNNGDFFGGQRTGANLLRAGEPDLHLRTELLAGGEMPHISQVDAQRVDGVKNNDQQEGPRFGATFALPDTQSFREVSCHLWLQRGSPP